MNIFDLFLIQPIFNALVLIYSLVPFHDFGVALILFTVLVRVAMWPLVKKQIRQSKAMREMQPEILKIKQKTKGNKVLEQQMTLELYREQGINPLSSFGLILIQLPIFIALYNGVNLITQSGSTVARFTYDFLEGLPGMPEAIAGNINHHLFGIVDLTAHATTPNGGTYWPLMIMAALAGALQFVQSKQLLPQPKEGRRLRDMLKEQAEGKQVDQMEINAAMTSRMVWLFPIMTFLVSIYLAGALVLYLLATSAVAVLQQAAILRQDENKLMKLGEKTKTRETAAKEAEVVTKTNQKGGKSRKKRRS